jgi:hypothetical protein
MVMPKVCAPEFRPRARYAPESWPQLRETLSL